jgi:hypothetical protein
MGINNCWEMFLGLENHDLVFQFIIVCNGLTLRFTYGRRGRWWSERGTSEFPLSVERRSVAVARAHLPVKPPASRTRLIEPAELC